MKRSEVTKESLCERGWRTCYRRDSDSGCYITQYTFEEVVEAVKTGTKVEKEVCLITGNIYIHVGGECMLFKKATAEELEEQKQIEEQARYERAIKRIHARNRARIRR